MRRLLIETPPQRPCAHRRENGYLMRFALLGTGTMTASCGTSSTVGDTRVLQAPLKTNKVSLGNRVCGNLKQVHCQSCRCLSFARWLSICFKVEINDYARKVLQKRMGEGLLHPGKVSEDITDFKPEKDSPAGGCGGGFPCQACDCDCSLHQKLTEFSRDPRLWQGISSRGSQLGLQDCRSALLKDVFDVYDRLHPKKRRRWHFESSFSMAGC